MEQEIQKAVEAATSTGGMWTIGTISTAILSSGAWLINRLFKLESKVNELEVELAKDYATKDDLHDVKNDLKDIITQNTTLIIETINNKE